MDDYDTAENSGTAPALRQFTEPIVSFALGSVNRMKSFKLATTNPQSKGLSSITLDRSLTVDEFIRVGAETAVPTVCSTMLLQVAVLLITVSVLIAADILESVTGSLPANANVDEGSKLAAMLEQVLGQALPYYPWHGSRNSQARVQSLMSYLEAAIEPLAVPLRESDQRSGS